MSEPRPRDPGAGHTAVIGVGNPLMGDDGVGIAALERLRAEFRFEPPVEWVDGGTDGIRLLPWIEDAARTLLLDAVRTGAAPGTVVTLRGEEVGRRLALRVSPHEIDLREVLALAELRDVALEDVFVLGVEPHSVEYGQALSAPVAAAVDALVAEAVARLSAWGHRARRAA